MATEKIEYVYGEAKVTSARAIEIPEGTVDKLREVLADLPGDTRVWVNWNQGGGLESTTSVTLIFEELLGVVGGSQGEFEAGDTWTELHILGDPDLDEYL